VKGEPAIVIYDADCLMCSGFMRTLARVDRKERLRFCSLQEVLPGRNYESVMLWEGHRLHQKSQAMIRILRRVGGVPGAIGALAHLLPAGLLDAAYDFIARRRHAFRRGPSSCAVPTEDFLRRLLEPEEIETLRIRVSPMACPKD
jgi:predicted DCC family thiol-disulfide oxidoreductase YuxK